MNLDLSTLFTTLTSVSTLYGYGALFVISFIAALALPLPAGVILAASGGLAAEGYLDISLVLITAFTATIIADITGYTIARRYGEALIRKVKLGWLLTSRPVVKIETYIHDFPQAIIYITRLVSEAGAATNLLAGLSRVPFRTFLIYDILGELSYVALFGLGGYFLGDAWSSNTDFLIKGALVLISFGAVIALLQMIFK